MKKHLKKSLKIFINYLKETSKEEIDKELNSLSNKNFDSISFEEFVKGLKYFEKLQN
jgi:hypothetical protein